MAILFPTWSKAGRRRRGPQAGADVRGRHWARTGVIYVPAFNGQTKLANQEIRKILLDTLPAIGEHAEKAGTRVVMEPLNRNEAFFLRQVADAASIARDCHSPGICVMGDFYHMFIEETSDLGAFISGGPYVHHAHLASRIRVLPGQDERSVRRGFPRAEMDRLSGLLQLRVRRQRRSAGRDSQVDGVSPRAMGESVERNSFRSR